MKKYLIFALLGLWLGTGCTPTPTEVATAVAITRLPITTTATTLAMTETATTTAVEATTVAPTATPTPPTFTATPIPTATPTPTVSPMPPSDHFLFMRDQTLLLASLADKTSEIMSEGVMFNHSRSPFRVSGPIVLLVRHPLPEDPYTLVVLHVPSRTEMEFVTLPDAPEALSLSPNGRWVAYESEGRLIVQEVIFTVSGLSVSVSVFTSEPVLQPQNLHLTWPTENEISWLTHQGIWTAVLTKSPIKPTIALLPSTHTYESPASNGHMIPTTYIPFEWSPDGRYLLAGEYWFETGTYLIMERGSNALWPIADTNYGLGFIYDSFVWVDATTLFHFRMDGSATLWQIPTTAETPLIASQTFSLPSGEGTDLVLLPNQHVRLVITAVQDVHYNQLYDLDLTSGQFKAISQDFNQLIPNTVYSWAPVHPQWSPDGRWAIVSIHRDSKPNTIWLESLNGEEGRDLTSFLGDGTCCWTWYTP